VDSYKERLWDTIDSDNEFVINLTRDLVKIPTVNSRYIKDESVNREKEAQELLYNILNRIGLETEMWDVSGSSPNLIAYNRKDKMPALLLCGHIDVVPEGDHDKWSVDPYGASIKNNRIYGRGAMDMKAGLAACVASLYYLKKAGIELNNAIAIHSLVDEEAGQSGVIDALNKGHLGKTAIIAEPTNGTIQPAEGGLEWARVTINGRSGHAGWRFNEIWPQIHKEDKPVASVNAIDLAARFLVALKEFESSRCRRYSHPLAAPGLNTIQPGVITGGVGIDKEGNPAVLTNPAITPDIVTIDLDYEYLPNENIQQVKSEFEDFVYHFCQTDNWLKNNPIKIQWGYRGVSLPPINTKKDHPLVKSLIGNHIQVSKNAPTVKCFEAFSDGARYAEKNIDTVIYGPGGDGLHGYDEYVEIKSLINTVKVMGATIIDICGTSN